MISKVLHSGTRHNGTALGANSWTRFIVRSAPSLSGPHVSGGGAQYPSRIGASFPFRYLLLCRASGNRCCRDPARQQTPTTLGSQNITAQVDGKMAARFCRRLTQALCADSPQDMKYLSLWMVTGGVLTLNGRNRACPNLACAFVGLSQAR